MITILGVSPIDSVGWGKGLIHGKSVQKFSPERWVAWRNCSTIFVWISGVFFGISEFLKLETTTIKRGTIFCSSSGSLTTKHNIFTSCQWNFTEYNYAKIKSFCLRRHNITWSTYHDIYLRWRSKMSEQHDWHTKKDKQNCFPFSLHTFWIVFFFGLN